MFRQENQKSMWKDNYYNICNGAAAGADVKPAIGRVGDIRKGKKKKAETQFDPGGAASGTELLKGSEVERAFLWMVNPPLNRAAGRAQMSAFTGAVSVSLLR